MLGPHERAFFNNPFNFFLADFNKLWHLEQTQCNNHKLLTDMDSFSILYFHCIGSRVSSIEVTSEKINRYEKKETDELLVLKKI